MFFLNYSKIHDLKIRKINMNCGMVEISQQECKISMNKLFTVPNELPVLTHSQV